MKRQLQDNLVSTLALSTLPPSTVRRRKLRKPHNPDEGLAKRVSTKIEEGDIKGAIRLASSDDALADFSDETYEALRSKHPPTHPDSHIPSLPDMGAPDMLEVSRVDVIQAIRSFPCGSAGGPDRLRPQHLKDVVQYSDEDNLESPILNALVDFCSMVLHGDVPQLVRPFFFGASLVALKKKSGGVRPIAVGCTLRRLVAKIAGRKVSGEMSELLAPRQLGFGVRGGAEAAVHAARRFLQDMPSDHAVVKLDFANAFNSVRRDCVLSAVQSMCPALYSFVYSAYAASSNLLWGDRTVTSAEGVQQGDPLGPLLFCLVLHQQSVHLRSEFQVLYLDDVTLGGSCEDLIHDIQVMRDAAALGLSLNVTKCEIVCNDNLSCDTLLVALPDAQLVKVSQAQLLGSPVGDDECVATAVMDKVEVLRRLGERLHLLTAHDALILLRNCFALPKLLYILRTAPCFRSVTLESYDDCLREILGTVTNNLLERDSQAWAQATLPVKLGGLGIRSAVSVAPSAFLASVHSTSELVSEILPPTYASQPAPFVEEAVSVWSVGHECLPPEDVAATSQKLWDFPRTASLAQRLLDDATSDVERARLLAVSAKESGAWLRALPVSSLGLRMDDNTVRIAVGLRLGTPICGPHQCHHCSVVVDELGRHALSCRRSEGRHQRHSALNDLVKRALLSAQIPSRLEPSGLVRSDGKRPDGVTLAPWKSGRLLVWDATCPDTFAPSYRAIATQERGRVAAAAEGKKDAKYSSLPPTHCFSPLAIETMGVLGPKSLALVREIGRRITGESGEPRSTDYLLQRLSVAVQRGNSASVCGSVPT